MPAEVPLHQTRTTCLIVDDHALFRNLLRTVLSGPDTEIIEASNGEDAMQAYLDHRPDWVIMDIDMPLKDGLTAARQIRESDSDARIVVVSQYDHESLRCEVEALGARAFVSKDNVTDLKETLNQLAKS